MKPIVYMRVVDWWLSDTKENFFANPFVQILSQKYDVRYSEDPEFLLYGPFGFTHLRYECVRIFFTGENVRTNWNVADYGIDFDYMDFGDRHLRLPLDFLPAPHVQELYKQSQIRCTLPPPLDRQKFCAFMATNGGGEHTKIRDDFFEILNAYKRVDSGGRWKNNIGGPIGDRYANFRDSKLKWLRNYRFHICFENSSYPGYLTEKLFDAYAAGCIPIYWGDTSLCENVVRESSGCSTTSSETIQATIAHISPHLREYTINPKAFVNAHNFATFQDLAQEVIRIDSDPKRYQEMYFQPIFVGDFDPYTYYKTKLEVFLDSIVSQGAKAALRRGDGVHMKRHNRMLIKGSDPLRAIKMGAHREISKAIQKCKRYFAKSKENV